MVGYWRRTELYYFHEYEFDSDRIAIFPDYMSDGPSYTGWVAIALGGEICFVNRFVKRLDHDLFVGCGQRVYTLTYDGGEEF